MNPLLERTLALYRLPLFELIDLVHMPRSRVRLSVGRLSLNHEAQLVALSAGANSIFIGDKLLTTPNVAEDDDQRLLAEVGA